MADVGFKFNGPLLIGSRGDTQGECASEKGQSARIIVEGFEWARRLLSMGWIAAVADRLIYGNSVMGYG